MNSISIDDGSCQGHSRMEVMNPSERLAVLVFVVLCVCVKQQSGAMAKNCTRFVRVCVCVLVFLFWFLQLKAQIGQTRVFSAAFAFWIRLGIPRCWEASTHKKPSSSTPSTTTTSATHSHKGRPRSVNGLI